MLADAVGRDVKRDAWLYRFAIVWCVVLLGALLLVAFTL